MPAHSKLAPRQQAAPRTGRMIRNLFSAACLFGAFASAQDVAQGLASQPLGLGKGRLCPGIPKSAKECPIKSITDEEFEPVCVTRETPAELQQRRCMPGKMGPYYKDSEGVFRCACCGAPLWKPHTQFDALPATKWPWPSFHTPPINGSDGLPNICHRGPGYGFDTTSRNATMDLGLGAVGETGCARCGAHLGDFFNAKTDNPKDHYCINGVCLTGPGEKAGEVCKPTAQPLGQEAAAILI